MIVYSMGSYKMVLMVFLQLQGTVSKLREDIQKLRSDLVQEHRKLVDAEESKIKANEEAKDAAAKLEESHKNVEKLVQEKMKIEMELKIKKQEYQLLSAMQEEDKVLNQFLKMKVDEKEKEIKSLIEELQMKESGLQFATQELQTQQEKLSKARKKLKKKHKEVMQLQKEKEELACSYNIEMERVSKLVQITSTLTSDREGMKVTSRVIHQLDSHTEGHNDILITTSQRTSVKNLDQAESPVCIKQITYCLQ